MKTLKKMTGFMLGIALGISMLVFPASAKEGGVFAAKAAKETVIDVDKTGIAQNNYSEVVYNAKNHGYYFVRTVGEVYSNSKKYEVIFYSLDDGTYKTVFTSVDRIEEAYVDNAGVYFALTGRDNDIIYNEDGTVSYKSDYTIDLYHIDFDTMTNRKITLDTITSDSNWANYLSALGVDGKGRIYVATNDDELLLYDSNGTFLSKTAYKGSIYEFYGFDSVNGNFYYSGYYNWVYWGYDHAMTALMAGNVNTNNKISLTEGNIMTLYQSGFFTHKKPVEMLNDRYLAALSTFNNDTCVLLDSNKYDYKDVTEESTSIDIFTSGVSVSLINIKNTSAVKLAVGTAESDYADDYDKSGIGSRTALTSDGKSLLVKTDSCILTEYDINTKKEKIKIQTKHPIYKFDIDGEMCVVLERDGDKFYVETIDITYPTTFSVKAPSAMKVGASGKLVCSVNSGLLMDYTYKSSDSSIVSVNPDGGISAWKAGTATITVKSDLIGVTKKITIKVSDSALSKSSTIYAINETSGTVSAIIHDTANSYNYGLPKTAYLVPLKKGGYERVEYICGKIIYEKYNSSFVLLNKKEIKCELADFGGFYSGSDYNYLVFGQQNKKESDSKEVIRVVKYSKAWKRLGACSIKGANTYIPFDAGGLDMTETGGKLYLHTCHEMYQSSDGLHHQANCTFVINEKSMKVVDSYYDVMNLSYGYVSHSFAQQIETDGEYIYRADLGDAYPRGIALTATKIGDKINSPSMYGTIVSIPGMTGNNYTGYTLGSLKLSDNNYIVAGSGITEKNATPNIFVNAGAKSSFSDSVKWITSYKESSNIEVLMPKLVKLNNTQFLLMWEEYDTKKLTYCTKMVLLDEYGNKASSVYTSKLALSMCDPVVSKEGYVTWYVTNNGSPEFIQINPYRLSKVQSKTKSLKNYKNDKSSSFDNSKRTNYKKGDVVIVSKKLYKITSSNTVTFAGIVNGKASSLSIPNSVKIAGKSYKVTAIASKACYGLKGLKKVVIGSNVAKIGKKAFGNCSKLKSIRIKSKKLKSSTIGASAFKGIYKKATISVPKSKYTAYKKVLLKKGVTKKMKLKKQ